MEVRGERIGKGTIGRSLVTVTLTTLVVWWVNSKRVRYRIVHYRLLNNNQLPPNRNIMALSRLWKSSHIGPIPEQETIH